MSEYNDFSVASILRMKDIERTEQFMSMGDNLCPTKKYNYFVSAHFGNGKQQMDAEYHAKHFRNVFDRKMCGRGRHLYKLAFVEEGNEYSYNERHFHWLIHKPKGMWEKTFVKAFKETWLEVCGSRNVVIKRIDEELGGINGLLVYLSKERDADGFIGNRSFIEEASDNAYHHKFRETKR